MAESHDEAHMDSERQRDGPPAPPSTGSPARSRGRLRRTMVGLLIVLASFGALTSTLTVWTHQALLNTDNWIKIVGPLGQNPQVVETVSTYIADETVSLLQVQQRTQQALPPPAHFLVAPLTQAVHDFVRSHVASFMQTSEFQQIWITTNRYLHNEVVAALRGQTTTVVVANDTLTLSLVPLIVAGMHVISQQVPGLISQRVTLPHLTGAETPAQAQQELSQALGISIPPDFGQIILLHSDQLATAQQTIRIFDALTIILPFITLALIVAAFWLSLDRRRTAIQFGIGLAVAFLLARVLVKYAEQAIVSAISNPTGRSIAQDVLQTALNSLLGIMAILLGAGIVLVVVAYLVGKPQWFRAANARIRAIGVRR